MKGRGHRTVLELRWAVKVEGLTVAAFAFEYQARDFEKLSHWRPEGSTYSHATIVDRRRKDS